MILADLIHYHAQENPGKTAYIFKEEIITFQDLNERVLRCAQGLKNLGVSEGSTFGLVLRNCPEFIILTMALSRLGAVAVPINFLEKSDRIALILNDAGAVGVLTAKEFSKNVIDAAPKIPSLKHVFLREGQVSGTKSFQEILQSQPLSSPPAGNENHLVMLLYTSGTTGNPKGVMLSNKNLISNMKQCLGAINLSTSDIFMCLLPMFHSFAWTTCVLIPLQLGIPCVINESLLPFDPVIKAIWKHKVSTFVAVPQIYGALTSKISGLKALLIRLLNPVRVCISGAGPLPAVVHQNFEKTFKIPLLEGYGLTECAPVATLNPEKKRKVGTVGRPLPGVKIRIVDENGQDMPHGDVGEVYIQGENVMQGYYNKKKETAEAITVDGWLRTGDMGQWDEDDYLKIVDRKKDLIIVKGLNVYPIEIENVLAEDPNVKEVAVVGKLDPETGDEIIRAFVTIKEGHALDKNHLFDLCRDKLAPYKRPRDIICLDELPKNALQKILKKDLRQL